MTSLSSIDVNTVSSELSNLERLRSYSEEVPLHHFDVLYATHRISLNTLKNMAKAIQRIYDKTTPIDFYHNVCTPEVQKEIRLGKKPARVNLDENLRNTKTFTICAMTAMGAIFLPVGVLVGVSCGLLFSLQAKFEHEADSFRFMTDSVKVGAGLGGAFVLTCMANVFQQMSWGERVCIRFVEESLQFYQWRIRKVKELYDLYTNYARSLDPEHLERILGRDRPLFRIPVTSGWRTGTATQKISDMRLRNIYDRETVEGCLGSVWAKIGTSGDSKKAIFERYFPAEQKPFKAKDLTYDIKYALDVITLLKIYVRCLERDPEPEPNLGETAEERKARIEEVMQNVLRQLTSRDKTASYVSTGFCGAIQGVTKAPPAATAVAVSPC